MKKYASVDEYIADFPEWEEKLRLLRSIVLKNPSIKETIKWNIPVFTVDGKNILGLSAFKSHVGLWFFQGALLKDEAKVLVNAQEGKTQAMRHWKFTALDAIPEALVKVYIDEAVQYQKDGKTVVMTKTSTFALPDELKTAFEANSSLKTAFEKLSNYNQKEYATYITTAKRVATKESRLQKIIPMILEGKGLNDKYK
ncbi:YdeI/OmpD-associated family protein [Kordia sp. YSTF-M3]|uniref:YdeI/OmpD-associated family protein n=1 Tax=Kordia aestuariivivens TaxID=2759037 RepID=A0ABR7QFI2_9FLAO|nr:DUF1801 domain-containing protein [Kordia aestuariivivens]MBC8757335.1 YdeI/OmpD-associated family protein [Kordia aestuariivivens]